MELLEWLLQEIIAHWIIVALGIGVTAMLGVVKINWPKVADSVQYALVCGVAIFVFLWLPVQSKRHIEALKQLGNKKTEKLEKFTNEQKASLNNLTEVLEKSANEQKEALDKLSNERPTRPYFALAQGVIRRMSKGGIYYLTVSVQNNDITAEKVVSHLLVLEESLDPIMGPLHSRREESANPVGPKVILSQHWWPVTLKRNARPKFVVFQVQYTNPLSNKTHSQPLFLKFNRLSQGGTFIQRLFNASIDEKRRIERYMEKRGISKLQGNE